ncbi:hypothetical protein TanjilG_11306 [Lupinus angustifolius]|uniref:HMA domain-containing protein n=1 Tax=Lupinus angustifolius TaxID=3871 RepID=A0A1J7H8K1_LUPAN|nr:PREDICTED: protein SODIUM POTASSIUM ROOT DEFECTIVE 2-like [Lupinus angustifolius]OIW09168.1 hypothetical protein TanjilG_11306 [Lupinus angustifolius]
MKGLNMLCSSSTSTRVISSIDHCSMVPRSTKGYHNIRRKNQLGVPCSSKLPISPKTFYEKQRKSTTKKIKNSDACRKISIQVRKLVLSTPNNGSSTKYLLSDLVSHESDKITEIALPHSEDKPTKEKVVVLRVSLHCKACEGKVRKHISKMEGVTSFNIDMELKKVTIMGHVTPLEVLASVSKVKNAQLWPSPTSL